jgi:FtsP/CotA-like multicopper oxidase with cupredoxin domain
MILLAWFIPFVLGGKFPCTPPCTLRRHYIAAVEVDWNYQPSQLATTTYKKAIYRGYTDASFTTEEERPLWLGIMGPIIRAQVGDVIQVVFRNNATRPFTVHPHGVFYAQADEGAMHHGVEKEPGASVAPGSVFTYEWNVPDRAGPGPSDASSMLWLYHSHVNEARDTNTGLIGPMLIYRQGMLKEGKSDVVPAVVPHAVDVDREFIVLWNLFEEELSWYNTTTNNTSNTKLYAVNGRTHNTLDGIWMWQQEKVRWHIAGFGNEADVHAVHWQNMLVGDGEGRTDTVTLLPATFRTLDAVAEYAGHFEVSCTVHEHLQNGQKAVYQVFPTAIKLVVEEKVDKAVGSGSGWLFVFWLVCVAAALAWVLGICSRSSARKRV